MRAIALRDANDRDQRLTAPVSWSTAPISAARGRISTAATSFLGGSGVEVPGPLLLIKNSVYLAGNTTSTDFPVTPGAGDTTYNGGTNEWGGDAFVARFTLVGKSGAPTARTK
jgi:hypothetical protein